MNRETAHYFFDELIKQKKDHYTMSEMIIILTSQYYNIIDLDKLIPELDPNEYDILNMRKELLSICRSYFKNLKSISENFSWNDKNEQVSSVKRVQESCESFFESTN